MASRGFETEAERRQYARELGLSRRQFIFWALAATGGLFAEQVLPWMTHAQRAQEIQIRERKLVFPGVTSGVNGWLIIHISDLHIGPKGVDFVDAATCKRVYELATTRLQELGVTAGSSQKKVVLLLTGDIGSSTTGLHGPPSDILDIQEGMEWIAKIPADMRIFVEGNHDIENPVAYPDIRNVCQAFGFVCLGWEGVSDTIIPAAPDFPFHLAGMRDITDTRDTWYKTGPYEAFKQDLLGLSTEYPALLLAHNPSVLDLHDNGFLEKYLDLVFATFSGHVHAGQFADISSADISATQLILVKMALARIGYDSKYVYGEYPVGQGSTAVVSSGIGYTGEQGLGIGLRGSPVQLGLYHALSADNRPSAK